MANLVKVSNQTNFLERYMRGTGKSLTAAQAEANYGIKMNIVNGNITDGYKIMDEAKYTFFLLKFQ